MMSPCQQSNSAKKTGVTIRRRIIAGVLFTVILALFVLLYCAGIGLVDMSRLFGICEFKRTYSLPCLTCYMTTSAQAFAQGRILESFYVQPAGALFCCFLVKTAIFALLTAVFGVDLRFLNRPLKWRDVKYAILALIIILCAGWAVTLARAIAENAR